MPRGPMSEEQKEHLRQKYRDRQAEKNALIRQGAAEVVRAQEASGHYEALSGIGRNQREQSLLDAAAAISDEPIEPAPPPDEPLPFEPPPPAEPYEPTPDTPAPGEAIDRARWTAGLPADVALLITDAEIEEMEAAEQKRAVDERKKQAVEQIRAQMRHEARVENDLIAASTLRTDAEKARLLQKGRIRINVPLNGSGNPAKGSAGFRVDGRVYSNGNEYVVTRAEYESLLPNHFGQWLAELRFSTLNQTDGESARAILGRQIPDFEFRPL